MSLRIYVRGKLDSQRLTDMIKLVSEVLANIDIFITKIPTCEKYEVRISMTYDVSDPESNPTLNVFLKIAQMMEDIEYDLARLQDSILENEKKII